MRSVAVSNPVRWRCWSAPAQGWRSCCLPPLTRRSSWQDARRCAGGVFEADASSSLHFQTGADGSCKAHAPAHSRTDASSRRPRPTFALILISALPVRGAQPLVCRCRSPGKLRARTGRAFREIGTRQRGVGMMPGGGPSGRSRCRRTSMLARKRRKSLIYANTRWICQPRSLPAGDRETLSKSRHRGSDPERSIEQLARSGHICR